MFGRDDDISPRSEFTAVLTIRSPRSAQSMREDDEREGRRFGEGVVAGGVGFLLHFLFAFGRETGLDEGSIHSGRELSTAREKPQQRREEPCGSSAEFRVSGRGPREGSFEPILMRRRAEGVVGGDGRDGGVVDGAEDRLKLGSEG